MGVAAILTGVLAIVSAVDARAEEPTAPAVQTSPESAPGPARPAAANLSSPAPSMAYWAPVLSAIKARAAYPAPLKTDADARGVQAPGGTVLLTFQIGADGALLKDAIKQSSGNEFLDAAALTALRAAAPFPQPPEASANRTVQLPLAFVTSPPPKDSLQRGETPRH